MENLTSRKCNTCGLEKPVSELVPNKRSFGGYMPMCRLCRNTYWKDRRSADPEVRKRAVDTVLRSKMLKTYGMVAADYQRMVVEHNDKCALCFATHHGRNTRFRSWNIDHDHRTGKVRGLLCHTCNIAVGQFEALADRIGHDRVLAYMARGGSLNGHSPQQQCPPREA